MKTRYRVVKAYDRFWIEKLVYWPWFMRFFMKEPRYWYRLPEWVSHEQTAIDKIKKLKQEELGPEVVYEDRPDEPLLKEIQKANDNVD